MGFQNRRKNTKICCLLFILIWFQFVFSVYVFCMNIDKNIANNNVDKAAP